MPIVTIQCIVTPADGEFDGRLVQQLADELGDLFESDPGGTWVRLSTLPREQYAENRVKLEPTVRPTFVEVLKRSLPGSEELAAEALQVAETVARVLGRPRENVHVIYAPPAGGRVAFGGKPTSQKTDYADSFI